MFEFKVTKKSKKSAARLGILKTSHGEIETPALVTVATKAVVKTLTSEEAAAARSPLLIANTFHLHLKPGEALIKRAGGLHRFMNWQRPLMTDSGGFQVFSLGFGRDLNLGKIQPGSKHKVIRHTAQPTNITITDAGVWFRSPIDGKKLFLGPKESMRIQSDLGADIIFAFDECTPPKATKKYIVQSLEKTHRWAHDSLQYHNKKQALFGIVQGSTYKDLRRHSAAFINSLGFDGFGIGGDLGGSKTETKQVLGWTLPLLDASKPRHLLGIGHLDDMEMIITSGVDLFDCTTPTQYARRGIAFTSDGKLNLRNAMFLKDKRPLDAKTDFALSQNYRRDYLAHLLRAEEITALRILTAHNLFYFNTFVEAIRRRIKQGKL